MAEIFLARGGGAGVERYCVLKRMLPVHASDRDFVRMFIDEARLAAQLHHHNIAQVYDIGKLDGLYYFTMEYVHGETVSSLIHRAHGLRRALSLSVALTIAAGVAAGLHHAHFLTTCDGRRLGIVHRDVSPSNLMVSYDGTVKVVDFGVAKALHRAQETLSGTIKGKISYLSPEQCMGQPVDRRSDLFSLGICLWELLTTERLYKRASDFETMRAIVAEIPPPPSSRRPDVPRELDALVARLLDKDPEARFQRADELIEAIDVVAARISATLSSSSLGRFMRELFGQRPEPWLDLDDDAAGAEALTVKCDSASLAIAIHAALPSGAPVLDSPPSVAQRATPAQAEAQGASTPRRSWDFPLAAPPATDHAIIPLPAELAPRALMADESASWSSDSASISSGLQIEPASSNPVTAASGLYPALHGPRSTDRFRHNRTLGFACVLFAVAAAIASVTITVSMPTALEVTTAARDASAPAPKTAAAPPAATLPSSEPRTSVAHIRVADAGLGQPDPGRVGASGGDESRTSAPPIPQSSEPPGVTVRRTERALQDATIARLYAAGRYYQVVVQCSAGSISAERAVLCFIAACHAENEVKAHAWLALLPAARRPQLVANCKQLGVDVKRPARPIPAADCAADPELCTHE